MLNPIESITVTRSEGAEEGEIAEEGHEAVSSYISTTVIWP